MYSGTYFGMQGRAGRARLRPAMLVAGLGLTLLAPMALGAGQEAPKPDSTPPMPPPGVDGLVVLFDGTPETMARNWTQGNKPATWKIEDGAMIATGSDLATKEKYTDFQLHVEFRTPYKPTAKGQARGNSGVILQGRFEIQVLDSYGFKEPGTGDCGAVYSLAAPLVNACKPPLQWQTYDITFHAGRLDTTTRKMKDLPHVTVVQNGLVVQNNQEIVRQTHQVGKKRPMPKPGDAAQDPTKAGAAKLAETTKPTEANVLPDEELAAPGPIRLQYHGNAVAYRNIWILPLPAEGAKHYAGH